MTKQQYLNASKLLMELANHKIKVIDLIIISHSDADHCRGVNNFLEKFTKDGCVKSICYNLDKWKPSTTMRLFMKKFLEIHRSKQIMLLAGKYDTSMQKKELI